MIGPVLNEIADAIWEKGAEWVKLRRVAQSWQYANLNHCVDQGARINCYPDYRSFLREYSETYRYLDRIQILQCGSPSGQPSQPRVNPTRGKPLVLGNYFAWFDGDGWDDCNVSAGDKPLQPYDSDDPRAIAQHVRMALDAGLDGFTLHWFAPGERTDQNFDTLLAQSQGTSFRSTVVFSRHIYHGSPAPTQQYVAEAIRYVLDQYGAHPNFLVYS